MIYNIFRNLSSDVKLSELPKSKNIEIKQNKQTIVTCFAFLLSKKIRVKKKSNVGIINHKQPQTASITP